MNKRKEVDNLGEVEINEENLYGIFTSRVIDNFGGISGLRMPEEFLRNYIRVKLVYAKVNQTHNKLDKDIAELLINSCLELLKLNSKEFMSNFPIDQIQSGGGTSTNMNVNEVITNLALKIGGFELGDYKKINPNDHVNMSQSSNDTFPGTLKITLLIEQQKLIFELSKLIESFEVLGKHNEKKVGRSHLQDAVEMLTGEEFKAFSETLGKELKNINQISQYLLQLNFGGTAIGSLQNIDESIRTEIIAGLSEEFGIRLSKPSNYFEQNSSSGDFEKVSASLASLSGSLIKIANDLRLLSSGPMAGLSEIILPEVQAGSSIMPGKVNPSILEALNMVCFRVLGNHSTIQITNMHAQLQLQAFMPIISTTMIESFKLLINGIRIFNEKCVEGIQFNSENISKQYENSYIYATDYAEKLGYAKVSSLVKFAYKNKLNLRDLLEKEINESKKQ